MAEFKDKFLSMVPEFTGQPETLTRFLKISDQLINKFFIRDDPDHFDNTYLIHSIVSKIKGDASAKLANHPLENWEEVKKALKNLYQDKRDLFTLNIELTKLEQKNDTPFVYYEKINALLNLIQNCITLTYSGQASETLIKYHQDLSLRVFLKGLNEPLSSLLVTKGPESLGDAFSMLTNEYQFSKNNTTSRPQAQKINFTQTPFRYALPPPTQNTWHFNNTNRFRTPSNTRQSSPFTPRQPHNFTPRQLFTHTKNPTPPQSTPLTSRLTPQNYNALGTTPQFELENENTLITDENYDINNPQDQDGVEIYEIENSDFLDLGASENPNQNSEQTTNQE